MSLAMLPGAAMGGGAALGVGTAGESVVPPASGFDLPLPLPTWLTGNPLFTGGFGLACLGAVAGVLRSGAGAMDVVLRRQLLMSLEIPSKDHSYQWVMQWLVARGVHASKHVGVETNYAKDAAGHQIASFDFVPAPGQHWVYYRGAIIRLQRERETRSIELNTGQPWETLTLTTLAYRPTLFQELLLEAKEAALCRDVGKTIIYQSYGHEWRPFGSPKHIRPFQSVILDGSAGEQILADVQEFLSSQSWYLDRGIPYRRGYLLHGPPGCGKSSYVTALAGELGYSICVLNLGDPAMTDDRLQHLLAVVPPRCIVLLEDIDFAVAPREMPESHSPYAGVMRVSFSGMLNALDGVVATDERIIFMTTNHFAALPRALVRPGRVDLNVYVGVATKIQMHRMFVRFFPGAEDLAEQFAAVSEGEGLSMAEIQGYFMYFKGKTAQSAFANMGPFLESRREVMADNAAKSGATPAMEPASSSEATASSSEAADGTANNGASPDQAVPKGIE